MGRPRTIDRDKVLDIAEEIVSHSGVAQLTMDAVAKAAGITKSGVQYCFQTKENLIGAMLDRWSAEFDTQVEKLWTDKTDPSSFIRAHIEATRRTDKIENARSAAMMTALFKMPRYLEKSRQWYREQMEDIDPTTERGRCLMLAFLASEGAFYLRCFGFMDISDAQWNAIFNDIAKLLPDPETKAEIPAA